MRTERGEHDGVLLSVADTGPGLGALPKERLFEPFFSTKDQGLGVGLSISRSIIERHGGTLAEMEPGTGACFRIWLPAGPRRRSQAARREVAA